MIYMAKFIYRMQNILDIKYKLEESAKQAYGEARARLNAEEEKLEVLKNRKQEYVEIYRESLTGNLNFLKIEENSQAVDLMDDLIEAQNEMVKRRSKELELARQKMAEAMQERKMHEKLRENEFEVFKKELAAEEAKEVDQVVSYQYSSKVPEEET